MGPARLVVPCAPFSGPGPCSRPPQRRGLIFGEKNVLLTAVVGPGGGASRTSEEAGAPIPTRPDEVIRLLSQSAVRSEAVSRNVRMEEEALGKGILRKLGGRWL
ncbi:hypothetical protein AAFF_G00388110 [Aldrovandia affinis]|uniref:Uncharacterized protein n=1 Tax=Aldrovandia affinis TaxID=143900 RepID=A0AAD7SEQ1_9TELE|nr:hypothetical protein AAFF_G00388110 [Aldrovandia affinis]